jgi:hypothetical protein
LIKESDNTAWAMLNRYFVRENIEKRQRGPALRDRRARRCT